MEDLQVRLTYEQRQAVNRGEPVRVTVEPERTTVVVLSAAAFDRIRASWTLFSDEENAAASAYPLVEEIMKEDWDGPKMAEYDQYDAHKK